MTATLTPPVTATLFERGAVQITRTELPGQDVIDLLADTVWGTPGGTLIRHLDTRELIHDLVHTRYINCYRNDVLFAALSFCERQVKLNDKPTTAFYIHHLSFLSKFRVGKSSKKQTKEEPKLRLFTDRRSSIRNFALNLFSQPAMISGQESSDQKAIYYAFIEAENTRSLEMAEGFGFEKMRAFSTLTFSRLNPKDSPDVSRVGETDKREVIAALHQQYHEHHLYFTDHIFLRDNYFVIRHQGEIVAGVQAQAVQWAIEDLPGFSGKVTRKVVPIVPWLSRLFNPKRFNPALLEAIFCKAGHEKALIQLIEAVLHRLQVNSALIPMDEQSEMFQVLRNSGKLGLLDKMQQAAPANVMARFVNYEEHEIEQFRNQPVYISAFDLT